PCLKSGHDYSPAHDPWDPGRLSVPVSLPGLSYRWPRLQPRLPARLPGRPPRQPGPPHGVGHPDVPPAGPTARGLGRACHIRGHHDRGPILDTANRGGHRGPGLPPGPVGDWARPDLVELEAADLRRMALELEAAAAALAHIAAMWELADQQA